MTLVILHTQIVFYISEIIFIKSILIFVKIFNILPYGIDNNHHNPFWYESARLLVFQCGYVSQFARYSFECLSWQTLSVKNFFFVWPLHAFYVSVLKCLMLYRPCDLSERVHSMALLAGKILHWSLWKMFTDCNFPSRISF